MTKTTVAIVSLCAALVIAQFVLLVLSFGSPVHAQATYEERQTRALESIARSLQAIEREHCR